MRLIVDTSVWSLALRRRDAATLNAKETHLLAELREAIQDRRVAILGPVRQEILSGIGYPAQFAKTAQLLDPFSDEEIAAADYIQSARLFNLCQNHGVQCDLVDVLICTVAIRSRFGILTSNQGLKRCIKALQAEGQTQ